MKLAGIITRISLACCGAALMPWGGLVRSQSTAARPNILFLVMDDVGIDQLAAFNPAAGTSALTPNINAVANAGVKFTKLYTMPECSPSRAAFFTGRYPLRTGVNAAILAQDLPAAQVSPYEVTTPRVLAQAGYVSGLIGKYHLGGPENNPDGNAAPIALGWNYFNGNMRGGPPPIDTTLGGQYTADKTKYSMGFPTGNQRGAVWFLNPSTGKPFCDDSQGGYTGKAGVEKGGIPALDSGGNFAATCADAGTTPPNFATFNAYYVWPKVVAGGSTVQAAPSRQYMTSAQTDAAIAWINSQTSVATVGTSAPWMATVAYNAIHTPYQEPPTSLYPAGFTWPSGVPESAASAAAQKTMSDLMLAAMDKEIGRLLTSTGLATVDTQGNLKYDPAARNTMVVIIGDNGSFLADVKTPYDPVRSKGTPYETGVLAPLIVAGPLVQNPGRAVDSMVNAVDLFQLFGEIAGVDVHTAVPASHQLDSMPMVPYLTNPSQAPIRQYNFTQLGAGLKPPSVKLSPCVVSLGPINIATDILFTTQSVCEDNGGKWFGPTAAQPVSAYPTSCSILQAGLYPGLIVLPNQVWAVRDQRYKLVKVDRPSCLAPLGPYEFYDLTPTATNPAGIDLSGADLLKNGQPVNLTAEQSTAYLNLMAQMNTLLGSEPACYGDGTLDKAVDFFDWEGVFAHYAQPSVFDYNADGVTDVHDVIWAMNNLGNNCYTSGPGRKPQ